MKPSAVRDIGRQALRAALDTRKVLGTDRIQPVCPIDAADKLGVQVWFVNASSFMGAYAPEKAAIVLNSSRPSGQTSFTCAHELGHHYFEHGAKIDTQDEYLTESSDSIEERMADAFAANFLMPAWSVKHSFDCRGWDVRRADPLKFYRVSCQLNVSYSALVNHCAYSLSLVSPSSAKALLKITPKSIKSEFTGFSNAANLKIIDKQWDTRIPIDVCTGDFVLFLSKANIEGMCLSRCAEKQNLWQAIRPGLGRAEGEFGQVFVRSSRKDFRGRAIYRHLDDPEFEVD